ncbi:N6-adenosine-specific RNA methylase IME4 [Bradyrhizobium erythrophlei]|nr:N6-adenosine-specific RNA methylase IME4 [Bradyrhizobium erythrophlei]
MGRIRKRESDPRSLEAYGALREGVFIAGFSFERACSKLEWLLEQDRWRGVGDGFDDVNKFISSIKLDSFRTVAEQRKRIALRIKQLQPAVSNRQIAKTLGVGRRTIDRDTGPNGPPVHQKASKINAGEGLAGPNGPSSFSGAAAAKAVEAKETKEERHAEKLEARVQREAALGAKQLALPDKKYGVIVADPEWRFEFYSPRGSLNSSADNHYETSALDVIKARDVPSIAADDCVLFLWATVPMLPHALEVMAAWGFLYVSNFAWAKDKAGTGYWNRNQHELLLVGRKGDIPAPAPGMQWPSVIEAPVTEHSAKPEKFLELIEAYFPTLPKIELNRRGPARAGWDAWGNEAEPAEVAA